MNDCRYELNSLTTLLRRIKSCELGSCIHESCIHESPIYESPIYESSIYESCKHESRKALRFKLGTAWNTHYGRHSDRVS